VTKELEFYFDFSSPYSYLASFKVDELAEKGGRVAVWKPILIGVAFKESGNQPLISQPLKGEYAKHDFARVARFQEVPWTFPEKFPIPTQAAARIFYWLDADDGDKAKAYAKAAFHRYFGEGRDIRARETAAEIAAELGHDYEAALAATDDQVWKDKLRAMTDQAIERGVCGAPFFFVDGEGFWGNDRLWMVKKWMQRGGW
jgi:2-hydroxychromene-2-carboxylate isomerase